MTSTATSDDRWKQRGTTSSHEAMAVEAARAIDLSPFARRFLVGLCGVLAVAMPLCLYLGVRGFAPVVGVAGLLCFPLGRLQRRDTAGLLWLAVLTGWAALSIIWSPAPNLREFNSGKAFSHFTIGHMALLLALCPALVAALGRLDPASSRKALTWIACGVIVATPVLIVEGLTGIKLYPLLLAFAHQKVRLDRLIADLAQAGYVVAVVAWPLGVALARRGRIGKGLAIALAAFTPLSMVVLRGVAPTAGLVIGLGAFMLVRRQGPRGGRILASLTTAYLLAVPLAMLAVDQLQLFARFGARLPPSWADRLRIWSFVAEQLARTFPRGAGLDASRTFPGQIPLHPHSGPLQVWYELGLVGGVLQILFWSWIWRRVGDCTARDRLHGATAAATAATYLAVSAVSFGQWQAWWLAVGGLAMGLCVLLGRSLAPAVAADAPGRVEDLRPRRRRGW